MGAFVHQNGGCSASVLHGMGAVWGPFQPFFWSFQGALAKPAEVRLQEEEVRGDEAGGPPAEAGGRQGCRLKPAGWPGVR